MLISSEKLAVAMARRCISITRLAEESTVGINTLGRIMKEKNRRVRIETAGKIAKALDCDVTELKA